MPPQMVERLIDRARVHWSFANDIEITLEANPSSVEASRFADFRAAGVNRISMGIQALNDPDLKRPRSVALRGRSAIRPHCREDIF